MALTMLRNHSWPGNFKQMEQVISYLISINTSGIIGEEDVLSLPDFKLKADNKKVRPRSFQYLQHQTF